MNNLGKKILFRLASIYQKIFNSSIPFGIYPEKVKSENSDASMLIKAKIQSNKPFMAARFGSGELELMATEQVIRNSRSVLLKSIDFVRGKIPPFWWDEEGRARKCYIAGIFPANDNVMSGFYDEMINVSPQIDILGSWQKAEELFQPYLIKALKVNLPDLEPYYHADPWSLALKGKKVLVIHPFEESIRTQYAKRKLLFANPDMLPDFELITIKAVQSITYNETGFSDWFEALNHMKREIEKTDFDIAIIGCGAYGMPLAAHVKLLGKQSIHLGGATQILFGIKGKRWDEIPFFASMYNEHWIRPTEIPENYKMAEGGSYW